MMYIQKNNTSNLRYSKMRSNNAALLPKKKVTIPKSSPIKPSCVSKRSVSLPPNLRKNTVKTKNLFWFIPKAEDSRKRRLAEQTIVASGAPEIPDLDAECQKVRQQQQKIPESVALNWITSSSTHSLSDSSDTSGEPMDDDDDDLFGLEFLDTSAESDNKHC